MDKESTKNRCQSCGLPLTHPDQYGTNKDGTENSEYCKYCFQNGLFIDPNMTLDQMIESSTSYMVKGLKMNKDKARSLSQIIIPQLKRWRQ